MKLRPKPYSLGDTPFFELQRLVEMDRAFKFAMLRERRAGTETFEVGVVKSTKRMRLLYLQAMLSPGMSAVGSPAYLCVESI